MIFADIILVILVAKSFYSIVLHVDTPRSIVFDEVHYGTVCRFYHQGQFHLDTEPPGGKLLMQLFLPKDDNKKLWNKVGQEFPEDFPLWRARLPPAVCGVLFPIIIYKIMVSLKFSEYTALVSFFLIVFDNAFTVQSKLFLPSSIILLSQCLTIYFSLFSSKWSKFAMGLMLGISLSLNTSSVITWIVISYIAGNELWKIVIDGNIALRSVVFYFATYFGCLIIIPIFIYIGIFYLHFALLPLPGPHQEKLSPAFQASFSYGPESRSKSVVYGSYVTLKSASKKCYLSSSAKRYPVQYEDKRYSSRSQIVTCNPVKESHNWWLVSHPHESDVIYQKLHNEDQIWLIHSRTKNELQASGIAAPLSPYRHEVSCYLEQVALPFTPLWTIKLKKSRYETNWKTLYSKIQFIHNDTETMLSVTNMKFPDSEHYEVVSDAERSNWAYDDTEWIAEEMFDNNFSDNEKNEYCEKFGFWDKFVETHILMYEMLQSSTSDHMHSSAPYMWPLSQTTIPYWRNDTSGAQIHLIGNISSWCAGIIFAFIYGIILLFWATKMQRKISISINKEWWTKSVNAFTILSLGWLLHMIWCLSCSHPLFLYHYLPALPYKHMLHACAVEIMVKAVGRAVAVCYAFVLVLVYFTYETLSPITFGVIPLSDDLINKLQTWSDSDISIHSK